MKDDTGIITPVRPAAALEDAGDFLVCHELRTFDRGNLESVRGAFSNAAAISLRQDWREMEEPGFAPGEVRVGWRGSSFLVLAELMDDDIGSRTTAHNQPTWLLGDTFEMFLRPVGQIPYLELHVTPNNHRLQLRFENAVAVERVIRNGSIKSASLDGEAFQSLTWVQPECERWFVYAEVPAASVCDVLKTLSGQQWRFSFGRYDYGRAQKHPVLSSSSPHVEPDFHRQEEWGKLVFKSADSPKE